MEYKRLIDTIVDEEIEISTLYRRELPLWMKIKRWWANVSLR